MRSQLLPATRSNSRVILRASGWLAVLVFSAVATGAPPSSRPASQPAGLLDTFEYEEEGLQDLDLLELEIPTVVSATRRRQRIDTLPYAASVITQEDIRLSGARSVPDALRLVPGVDVAELSYGNAAVSPRGLHGFSSRHTLLLVDGRQIYDGYFGTAIWGSWPFQLEDIERIEVIRGPGGVTWGANAVNGVINIVTKDPRDQTGLTATGQGGSRGVNNEHLGYGFQTEKLALRVSGEYEGTDGFRRGGTFLNYLDDDLQAGRMGLHAVYDAGPDDTFTISGGHATQAGGFPLSLLNGLERPKPSGSQTSFILGRWTHRIAADNQVELTTYVNDAGGSTGLRAIDYRYQQIAFQLNHSFQPADDHTLTWGFDSRADLADPTNADPPVLEKDYLSTGILGLYVEDEWRFAPKWTLNLGARIDYEFYGGFEPSARLSLARELSADSMVYAAVSRAFQMPPAALRFVDLDLSGGLMNLGGDRDVHATQLIAYEAGWRGRPFERVETALNVYCHTYQDHTAIPVRLGPPGLFSADFRNGSDVLTSGFESEARWAVTDKLTLLGNYTFEVADWEGPTSFADTDQVSMPRNKFMLGARYRPIRPLNLSGHLYYVDSTQSPDRLNPFGLQGNDAYLRLDLRAEYEFWKDRASVSVGVRNLLDPHHYEGTTHFLNNAEVPRMVYAEIRFHLD